MRRNILLSLLSAVLAVGFVGMNSDFKVYAGSPTAEEAYLNCLQDKAWIQELESKYQITFKRYAMFDLNGDAKPELLIKENNELDGPGMGDGYTAFFEYDELTGAVNQIPVDGFEFDKGTKPENLLSLYYGPMYSRPTNSLVYSSGEAHSQDYYLYQNGCITAYQSVYLDRSGKGEVWVMQDKYGAVQYLSSDSYYAWYGEFEKLDWHNMPVANTENRAGNIQSVANYNDYIFPDSDSRLLTNQDIQGMSLQLINYAKNEIYARRNRMFNSSELQGYFKGRSWYQPLITADAFSESIFNSIEFSNAQFLAECERNMGMYKLDQSGYSYQPVYDYMKAKGTSGAVSTGSSSAADNSAGQTFSASYVDVSELLSLGAEDAARKAGFVLIGNYSRTAYETQNGRSVETVEKYYSSNGSYSENASYIAGYQCYQDMAGYFNVCIRDNTISCFNLSVGDSYSSVKSTLSAHGYSVMHDGASSGSGNMMAISGQSAININISNNTVQKIDYLWRMASEEGH